MVQEQLDGASKRRSELEVEEARPKMSPEEQRAALLAQIKADNEAIEVAAQKARDAADASRRLEARLGGVESTRSMFDCTGWRVRCGGLCCEVPTTDSLNLQTGKGNTGT